MYNTCLDSSSSRSAWLSASSLTAEVWLIQGSVSAWLSGIAAVAGVWLIGASISAWLSAPLATVVASLRIGETGMSPIVEASTTLAVDDNGVAEA